MILASFSDNLAHTHTHTLKRQNTDNIHTITVTEKSMPTHTLYTRLEYLNLGHMLL